MMSAALGESIAPEPTRTYGVGDIRRCVADIGLGAAGSASSRR